MTLNKTLTIYGAYGHTGRFVVSELRKRGWMPILSGRDADKLKAIAAEHPGLEIRPALNSWKPTAGTMARHKKNCS